MKKTMIAAVAALAMSGAMAAGEYVTVEGVNTDAATTGVLGRVIVGKKFGDLVVEGRTGGSRAGSDTTWNSFADARAKYSLAPVYGFTPWGRAAVGEKLTPKVNYAYWKAEAGVTYSLPYNFGVDVFGFREEAFDNTLGKKLTVGVVDVTYVYNFDKENSVKLMAERDFSTVNTSLYTLSLKHQF
jgi:hypothetical protein